MQRCYDDAHDDELRGIWAGGSDMLAKAVEYILSSPAPVWLGRPRQVRL